MLKEWRTDELLIKNFKQNEGYSGKLYKCSAGYNTIGFGHNLDAKGIKPLFGELLLLEDINDTVIDLDTFLPWWRTINESSQRVLIDMAFNLGIHGLLKFEKMLGLLRAMQYESAASELIHSKYGKQVVARATRNFNNMRASNVSKL
jgi:lysozyme